MAASADRAPRPRRTPLARRGAALLVSVLTACGAGAAGDDGSIVTLRIDPDPPRVGTARVALGLIDPAGAPITGAEVSLEGNMSHAGMVPSFADLAEEQDRPGSYAGDLELTMGGDWFLLVEARLADGRVLERTLDLPGVASR